MTRMTSLTAASLLMMLGGCIQPFSIATRSSDPQHPIEHTNETSAHGVAVGSDAGGQDCSNIAHKRLAMYDKPDTFPVSDKEKQDAYNALYSECVNGQSWQVATASHNNVPANDAVNLANLSPASGGNAYARGASVVNAPGVSTAQMAGATVIVIGGAGGKDTASQLSSLSPASGGNNAASPNATVVLVQSPAPPQPLPGYYSPAQTQGNTYYRSGGPLPVAVPVAPAQGAYAPAGQPQAGIRAPMQTMAGRQPSLASADAAVSGNPAPTLANQQLQNVLEK